MIKETMKELAQYTRMQEELQSTIDGLKDTIKAYMVEHGLDTLSSDEHKATYKTVTSSRIDTSALKKDLPDLIREYTKTTTSNRFTFT